MYFHFILFFFGTCLCIHKYKNIFSGSTNFRVSNSFALCLFSLGIIFRFSKRTCIIQKALVKLFAESFSWIENLHIKLKYEATKQMVNAYAFEENSLAAFGCWRFFIVWKYQMLSRICMKAIINVQLFLFYIILNFLT